MTDDTAEKFWATFKLALTQLPLIKDVAEVLPKAAAIWFPSADDIISQENMTLSAQLAVLERVNPELVRIENLIRAAVVPDTQLSEIAQQLRHRAEDMKSLLQLVPSGANRQRLRDLLRMNWLELDAEPGALSDDLQLVAERLDDAGLAILIHASDRALRQVYAESLAKHLRISARRAFASLRTLADVGLAAPTSTKTHELAYSKQMFYINLRETRELIDHLHACPVIAVSPDRTLAGLRREEDGSVEKHLREIAMTDTGWDSLRRFGRAAIRRNLFEGLQYKMRAGHWTGAGNSLGATMDATGEKDWLFRPLGVAAPIHGTEDARQ